jgi:NTP pyrophosphatase (non-canonical NTP hydrolase)
MKYEQLEKKVNDWAKDKGIFEKSTPLKQIIKTEEELDETLEALRNLDQYKNENNIAKANFALTEVEDGIGDMLVTIIILANMVGLDSTKCLESAYNVIKGRTGKMVNGLFIKDK